MLLAVDLSRAAPVSLVLVALLGASTVTGTTSGAQPPASASGVLRIQQLDVGQGDAALITTPEGRRILIDAGPNAEAVATLLRAERIDTLDLVIASHNHADHIGGMPRVVEAVVVKAYLDNGLPQATAIYRRTITALEREPGLLYLRASDRTLTVGTVSVRILASPGVSPSQNNNSVGVLITHGAFSALYTGDSETPQLDGWLRQQRIPAVTVVKVAHHGSWNGTTPAWVRATAATIALISVGRRNSYGHPSPQVEMLWSAAGARVFRTDRHGTIEIDAAADGRVSVRTGAPQGVSTR